MNRYDDVVVILVPETTTDPYTEEEVPDWSKPPTEVPSDGAVQPVSSTEAAVTAGTVISRWECHVPPDTVLEAFHRVRWDGDVYEVDGKVMLNKAGRRPHHKACILKLVQG